MLPSAKKIKKTAKDILKDYHFQSIIAGLPFVFSLAVWILISGILMQITGIYLFNIFGLCFIFFLIAPLFVGTVRFFSRGIDGVWDNPSGVFYYYSEIRLYKKALGFILRLLYKLAVLFLFLSLPSMIIGVFATSKIYELFGKDIPLWTPILSTVSGLLLILAIIVFLIASLKYYLAVYLFVIDEEITPNKALNTSVIISRRTKIDFVFLIFGMIIYIALSLLFLPLIITLPIMLSVYVIHSKCAILQYNKTIDSLSKNKDY